MFAHPLTINFAIGVSIVFVSMHQFFSFGDKAGGGKPPLGADGRKMLYSPSMDHISVQAAADNGGLLSSIEKAPLLPR